MVDIEIVIKTNINSAVGSTSEATDRAMKKVAEVLEGINTYVDEVAVKIIPKKD